MVRAVGSYPARRPFESAHRYHYSIMIYDNFISEVKKYHMFHPQEKVLLAVSGGPDSVALLLLFLRLKKKLDLDLSAVHINHNLRASESNSDEKFVRRLCKEHNINLYIKKIGVSVLAKKEKLSLEDAAREARCRTFEKICKKYKIKKVVLAHTKDDQAETYLMRLLRGAGLKGLSGIWPVREHKDLVFMRPLLGVSKAEIIRFLKQERQNYRIDSSNLKPDFLRNKIRLKTIPYLRKNFNPQLCDILSRQTDVLRQVYQYIQKEAELIYARICTKSKKGIDIDLVKFRELDTALAFEVLRLCLLSVKGHLKDISYDNLNALWQMSQNKAGSKVVILSDEIRGVREYSSLRILTNLKAKAGSKVRKNKPKRLKIPGITEFKDLNCKIYTKILKPKGKINSKNDSSVEYIDFDKIQGYLRLRTRVIKDKFTPLGLKNRKSLKNFFIDLKIPVSQRNNIPLVIDNENIVWVAGFRISEDYKVNKETCRILKLKITELLR